MVILQIGSYLDSKKSFFQGQWKIMILFIINRNIKDSLLRKHQKEKRN